MSSLHVQDEMVLTSVPAVFTCVLSFPTSGFTQNQCGEKAGLGPPSWEQPARRKESLEFFRLCAEWPLGGDIAPRAEPQATGELVPPRERSRNHLA